MTPEERKEFFKKNQNADLNVRDKPSDKLLAN